MTSQNHLLVFMMVVILISHLAGFSSGALGSERGGIRDDQVGFYLEPPDELGLQWVMLCREASGDRVDQWSQCEEVSVIDPVLHHKTDDERLIEGLVATAIAQGDLSMDQMADQITQLTQEIQSVQQALSTATSTAIGSGGGLLAQLGISEILQRTDLNQIHKKTLSLPKKMWGHQINFLAPLKNIHLRYFLSLTTQSKAARVMMVGIGVSGGVAMVIHKRTFSEILSSYTVAETSTYELYQAFLNQSSQVIEVDDAYATLTHLLSAEDLSADHTILLRMQHILDLPVQNESP